MSTTNKLTGKAASWTYKGTTIPFTKITPSTERTMADTTDSTDYDTGSDMIWPSQLPIKAGQKLKVEGKYNTSALPTSVLADLFNGATAAAVTIKLTAVSTFGHGNFDITNFEAGIPVDDVVDYSVELMSNGVFTYGS